MQKPNHTAIGFFVIGAVALTIICVLLFGTGHFFENEILYSTSFDTSVNGLNPGAPVMFRGIKIGEVVDIKLSFDQVTSANPESESATAWPIQVSFKLFPNSIAFAENRETSWFKRIENIIYPNIAEETMNNWLYDMVTQKGMRAQLETQNYLTGLLYIEFDLFKEEEATPAIKSMIQDHIVPTRMSAFERLYLSLNQNNFSKQFTRLYKVVDVIGRFFSDGKAETLLNNMVSISDTMDGAVKNLDLVVKELRGQQARDFAGNAYELMQTLNESAQNLHSIMMKVNQPRTDEILDNMNTLIANSSRISKEFRNFVFPEGKGLPAGARTLWDIISSIDTSAQNLTLVLDMLKQKIPAVLDNANESLIAVKQAALPMPELQKKLTESLRKIDQATAEGAALMTTARAVIDPSSPLMADVTKALEDAQKAARSIRSLADLLTDSPEAILRGRRE